MWKGLKSRRGKPCRTVSSLANFPASSISNLLHFSAVTSLQVRASSATIQLFLHQDQDLAEPGAWRSSCGMRSQFHAENTASLPNEEVTHPLHQTGHLNNRKERKSSGRRHTSALSSDSQYLQIPKETHQNRKEIPAKKQNSRFSHLLSSHFNHLTASSTFCPPFK